MSRSCRQIWRATVPLPRLVDRKIPSKGSHNFTKFFILHRKLHHVKDPSLQRMDTSASTNFRRRRFDEYCREFDPCFFGPEDEPYISVRRRPLSNRDTLRDPSFHAPSIHTPSIHTHGHYS